MSVRLAKPFGVRVGKFRDRLEALSYGDAPSPDRESKRTPWLGGILWALGLEKGDGKVTDVSNHLAEAEAKECFKLLFNGLYLSTAKPAN